MNLEDLYADLRQVRSTERRTIATSLAAHALLFLCLLRLGHAGPKEEWRLTEVALLEPGAGFEAPAAAPAPAAPATQTGVLKPRPTEVHFRRHDAAGESAPDPQSARAFEDRLNERLATLQQPAAPSLVGLATMAPRTPQLAAPAGLLGARGTGGDPSIALHRGGASGAAPLELARGTAAARDLGLAELPAEQVHLRPAPPPRAGAPRASLAGVSLAGPIADRPVLDSVKPVYPEWAKSEAVEGSVALYFVVLPDGRVKESVMVQKTAGFEDFDDNAIAALRDWRFAPLPAGRTGEQWGTITFHFRIADAR